MLSIRDMHTKELLNALPAARRAAATFTNDEYDMHLRPVVAEVYATYEEIIGVLSCREHVPNKQESKRIRQLRGMRK
jgi:hypothetical protein